MNKKLLFLYAILIVFSLSCTHKKETITPEVKNITESVYASGFIKSKNQYDVYSLSNGLIKKVFVTEGMHVKKGDPIFQLDDKNLKLATENAKLVSTASDYHTNADKLLDAQKAIELAKKKLHNDSLLFYRQKNLWSKNIGSKIEFEQKELNFENSKVNLNNIKTNYEVLKRELKLLSQQSKNNLKIAERLEDDFIVRSKLNGIVYKINKENGEFVNGTEPVAIIGEDQFKIELNIDELDIVKIKKDQQVFIRMDSYKSQVFEAKIIAINPMMNIRTRSFQADAIFTKNPTELFPNLTVEANILINTKQKALTIPRNYLLNDTTVILKGGTLQKIEIGLMDYDLVEIKSGLNKTTKIELPQ
ncbi:efflux RND transporter periplasmic adaptor subunit [Polaribacter sp. MSW13]|uniref:Efflux RND transporter periplasmic adaptor subunit n=1 Tax=Polaribacter marinus TaxID=2916838 RepID=A0A9X1VSL7_9FLAO|nr:efflux RND transporter periplasmic adaptor subunit [Polaribacter marinus]MCI2230050.1 efflux RND transporter periplasmic adaptor subunit [Polaribacter marinus]